MNTSAQLGKKMAAQFNDMDESDRKNPLDYINENNRNSMYLAKTDATEIIRLILSLDVRKSCGYDQISNKVLIATCYTIAPFLEILFNRYLRRSRSLISPKYSTYKVNNLLDTI